MMVTYNGARRKVVNVARARKGDAALRPLSFANFAIVLGGELNSYSIDGGFGPESFGDIKKFNRVAHAQSLVKNLVSVQS